MTAAHLSPSSARHLTDLIVAESALFSDLLLRAWDGRAHDALGYTTWDAYVDAELGMERSTVYRRLNHARVNRALSPIGDTALGSHARELTRLLGRGDDAVLAVWTDVKSTGPVTAKRLAAAVASHLGWEQRSRATQLHLWSGLPAFLAHHDIEAANFRVGTAAMSAASADDTEMDALIRDFERGRRVYDQAIRDLKARRKAASAVDRGPVAEPQPVPVPVCDQLELVGAVR